LIAIATSPLMQYGRAYRGCDERCLRRHSNLANVVDDCGQAKNLKSLCAQSELGPNREGQIRNAILVLDRERIPVTVGGRKNCDAWTE
jgi:hypothetical protein